MRQVSNAFAISAVMLLLGSASSGHAQHSNQTSQKAFSAGAAMVGGKRFIDASVTTAMIGGYGYHAFNRLLVGGEGVGLVGERASGGYGLFTVGYAAWIRKNWQVYPFGGYGGANFTVDNRSGGGNFVFGVGLGVDVIATGSTRGFTVGARTGYIFRLDVSNFNTFYLTLSFGGGG